MTFANSLGLILSLIVIYFAITVVGFSRNRLSIEECNKSIQEDPESVRGIISKLLNAASTDDRCFQTDGLMILDKLPKNQNETILEKNIPGIVLEIEKFMSKVCSLSLCDQETKTEMDNICKRLADIPNKPKYEKYYRLFWILTFSFLLDWITEKVIYNKSR